MAYKTLVALFDERSEAELAAGDLKNAGLVSGDIEIFRSDYAGSYLTGSRGTGEKHDVFDRLRAWGVPDDDAHAYAEGVRRGGTLIAAPLDEGDSNRALAIVEGRNVVDIRERAAGWRAGGWSSYDRTAAPYDETSAAEERTRYAGMERSSDLSGAASALREVNTGTEESIPLAEEHIEIGKREVERGGVRVRAHVVETPVHEQVRLRDETVSVERRPVSRPVAGDVDFSERTIEVSETDEEAVVAKRAEVTEEVVIRKDVGERIEEVSDTVRRTEVEIEKDPDIGRNKP